MFVPLPAGGIVFSVCMRVRECIRACARAWVCVLYVCARIILLQNHMKHCIK